MTARSFILIGLAALISGATAPSPAASGAVRIECAFILGTITGYAGKFVSRQPAFRMYRPVGAVLTENRSSRTFELSLIESDGQLSRVTPPFGPSSISMNEDVVGFYYTTTDENKTVRTIQYTFWDIRTSEPKALASIHMLPKPGSWDGRTEMFTRFAPLQTGGQQLVDSEPDPLFNLESIGHCQPNALKNAIAQYTAAKREKSGAQPK